MKLEDAITLGVGFTMGALVVIFGLIGALILTIAVGVGAAIIVERTFRGIRYVIREVMR